MSGETLHPSFALHCRGDFYREAYLSFTYSNVYNYLFLLKFFFYCRAISKQGWRCQKEIRQQGVSKQNYLLQHRALDFSAVADRHKHCTLNREKRILLLSIFVYIKLYFEKKTKRAQEYWRSSFVAGLLKNENSILKIRDILIYSQSCI